LITDFLSINLIAHYFLLEIPGYIDPSSMIAILTLLMGVIAGVGMTLKLYWNKLKLKLFHKDSN
jgi:thioredoxin-related protein